MEKQIKTRRFSDNQSKLTSEDIDLCNDVNQLLTWKLSIDGNIADSQMQIDTAKGKAAANGEYSNPEWYAKLTNYRRVLGFLSQKIQMKLRELNYKNKKDTRFEEVFMTMAREVLSLRKFEEIYKATKEKINSEPQQ